MGFTFRLATADDAELLAQMRVEMRKERETAVCAMPEAEFFRCNVEFFRTHLASGDFISFLAFDGDEAAACSGMSLQVHPPTYADPSGRSGYITNMFTRPRWRHLGLAKKLVDLLAGAARTAGCRTLVLNASAMGRPLYEKYGFKSVDGEMSFEL
ncbi:MAG: GNAT family N-acetyltransferase [Lentisphaeria bacterium]|nr:GNAT family N-acetyltransferase [Lentisphaeria bacterium]